MDDSDPFATAHVTPTIDRPLLGLTILVVEDSRYACEAMRLLCLRSGARIRRADNLRSARRHLRVYRPSCLIVDMGLPDGSGADLIAELALSVPRVPVILGISGDDQGEALAIAAGADGFLAKPVHSLAAFQNAVLSRMPTDNHYPPLVSISDEMVEPDRVAYHDDMAHAATVMTEEANDKILDYVAQFVRGVARSVQDTALVDAAERLARARARGAPVTSDAARLAGLVQQRLQDRKAI
ncbi:response regulator [Ruegeria hyattellae]|uniref:response regulator n=1 Tax=Ruegeria hyattellae TaxID=3233337 RepID=UPI00355B9A59